MTWEYRVLWHTQVRADRYLAIHTVYYEEGETTPSSWSENAQIIAGDTKDDLRIDLELMLKALDKPILQVIGERLEEV